MIGKTLGQVIEDWKIELIYPINKTIRSDWNQDLKLMCPITLLETSGTNYTALKNESTFEPLNIIQEDANKTDKEVWILLMDISKAYDS
ncbi:hypothetical protein RhiirA5_409042 [Rhizophagus irregularis]|uniref:Reverse transcriptase domain-containing protein n=1 Tax=Rhizophagus irregularis TaxID=588596 RepID=A0A2N0Q142_9GLOM|nr:hypothetical protein RhiirA5_411356 [Rhizophagus irregularis]PKC14760.1 hypothetical protein RhiirA5_409042 [Rhizophagus irregularis]